MGFGVPVDLRTETVIVGSTLKARYYLPTNVTDYTNPGTIYSRKKRSLSRWDLYKVSAEILSV